MKKILIDLQQNLGGDTLLAIDTFKHVEFPLSLTSAQAHKGTVLSITGYFSWEQTSCPSNGRHNRQCIYYIVFDESIT